MFHCGPQSCFRHQPVDKPQTQSVIRAERFTGKNQLVGLFGADQLRQHNSGKRRKDAHLDLGLRKLGVGGGDHHVAEGNQLRARTDGGAIHHNDQGLGDVAECLKDAIEGVQGLKDAVGFGVFQRDAGAKCLLRRVEDDALDVIAPIQAFHCLGYFHHQGHSENVVRRMVQSDVRGETAGLKLDELRDLPHCGRADGFNWHSSTSGVVRGLCDESRFFSSHRSVFTNWPWLVSASSVPAQDAG